MKLIQKIKTVLSNINIWLDSIVDACLRPYLQERGKLARFLVPNMISLTRVPLAFLTCQVAGDSWGQGLATVGLILFTAFTDKVDGVAARIMGPTKFGAAFDPLCDKIYVLKCVWPLQARISRIAVLSTVSVEVVILLAQIGALLVAWWKKLEISEEDFKSNIVGKTKLALECFALLLAALWLKEPASLVLYLVTVTAIGSIIQKVLDVKREHSAEVVTVAKC